jgi:hypothetical protein
LIQHKGFSLLWVSGPVQPFGSYAERGRGVVVFGRLSFSG